MGENSIHQDREMTGGFIRVFVQYCSKDYGIFIKGMLKECQ